ncbi:MAG: 3-deoxy-D-manno-octulosonic acid transferase [Candidatus Cloacimonetes bacterium]|nr:3-deoxy-D-manno-octulosonic acid transferase [Candidatus Cloacimonadota bacterium]
MIIFLYHILLFLLEIIVYPFMIIRVLAKKQLSRLGVRIPSLPESIWFHAASVGEVNALKALIMGVADDYPETKIVLTTVTQTGQDAAEKISDRIFVTYLPLDFPVPVKTFLNQINPDLLVIMETELWPQILFQTGRKKIPVLLVNARLTQKGFDSYMSTMFFWKHFFKYVTQVNAQSELDAERFLKAGFQKVDNTGNLKLALYLPQYSRASLRKKWGFRDSDFIIVFGSSRPGEEEMLLKTYPVLKSGIPDLKIVIAPRHLKRVKEITDLYRLWEPAVFSEEDIPQGKELLLINKMGLLPELYALADLALIGGSFIDFGGHNPLEAAFYGIPIIMGKYHSSCQNSVQLLRDKDGIIICDQEELPDMIIKLAKDKQLRNAMGMNAQNMLKENSQALPKNLKKIKELIKNISD